VCLGQKEAQWEGYGPVAYQVGVWGVQPPLPRNSEVLTTLSRIPSSVENTSVTVYCSYSIILIILKIAEFRTPTPEDVQEEAVKF
jgi:hypothetical protein